MRNNFKLFTAIFAVLLVAGVSIFYACEKEQGIFEGKQIEDAVVEKTEEKYLYQVIFEDQKKQSKNDPFVVMNRLSTHLVGAGISQISIATVDINTAQVNVQRNSEIFMNGMSTDFDDRDYAVTFKQNLLIVQPKGKDFFIQKNLATNQYSLYYNKKYYDIKDVMQSSVIANKDEIGLLMAAMLLNEFGDVPTKAMIYTAPKRAGTGIGFHWNKSDAKYFCERDYNKILAENPNWYGTGVSYSCIWEETLCVCTANFYYK